LTSVALLDSTETGPDPLVAKPLSEAQVELLQTAGGVVRETTAGEVLFKEGTPPMISSSS